MNAGGEAKGPRPAGLLIVRNTFEHDARVLRAARTLQSLGFDTTVLAVVSPTQQTRAEEFEGIHVRRLGPSSRLSRRLYRRLRPAAASPPRSGEASAPGAPNTPARAASRRLLRLATTLAYYRRAIGFVRAVRPRLVHCNDYNTMWVGVAARFLLGSVVIYDSHELWPDRNMRPEPRWWLMLCEVLFVRVARAVVMTSPAHAEVMGRRYRITEPVVVRNIPDVAPDARPSPNGAGPLAGDPPVAVYVGGLLRHRGLEEAIRALARVQRVHLRLIGPVAADYRDELERLAESLGVADRVHLPGPVPPTQVVDALRDARVGLALFQPNCLSHRLVLPNKLFEYALAGVPVVASDLPMIARFIGEHELGVTVDARDPDAIAAALEEVTDDQRNPRYRVAAARAAATLDWRREREILTDVYREALATSPSS